MGLWACWVASGAGSGGLLVLLARVSSNPPSPVPLLQTSQVWVPVCFRLDTGMGLGPWALALGGAWAFALGASLALALGACASRLPLPSQTFVTQQHGCHLLPHACSKLYVMLLGVHCLGWLGSCAGEGVASVRRAVGASPHRPAHARLARLLPRGRGRGRWRNQSPDNNRVQNAKRVRLLCSPNSGHIGNRVRQN